MPEWRKIWNLVRFSLASGFEISSKKKFLFALFSLDVPLRISEKVSISSAVRGVAFSEDNGVYLFNGMYQREKLSRTSIEITWKNWGRWWVVDVIWKLIARQCLVLQNPSDSPLESLLWWKLSACLPFRTCSCNDTDLRSFSEFCNAWKESWITAFLLL